MTEFHRTRMGEKFYCKTVPDLIRELARLNELLERLVTTLERRGED